MPSVPASSSSSSSNNFPKQRKRWTRDQILSNLQILGDIAAPLPPVLPPSPPASRSSSPAPALSTKRRSDSAVDSDHIKRLRTTSTSSSSHRPAYPPHHHQQHSSHQHSHPLQHQLLPPPPLPSSHPRDSPAPPQPPPPSSRSEPAEDGEVREEPPSNERGSAVQTGPSSLAPSQVPIRRPRKGKLTSRHFDDLHDQYHNAGRLLKYSGDARFWSTYPPSHREFRPLANPPPPGSPYHKHGGLIARLELVDALVCFAYSIWNRDYGRRQCNRETWRTIEAFLGWCKQKWQAEDAINDAEKAFIGLIWMMEAFIHGRKMQYAVRSYLDRDMDAVQRRTKEKIAAAAEAAQKADDNGLLGVNAALLAAGKSQATPTMLPSPASIAPANSANSTPTGRGDGTPNTANSRAGPSSAQPPARASAQPSGPLLVPKSLMPKYLSEGSQPIPQHVNEAMAAVTEPITPNMVHNLKDLTAAVSAAGYCMMASQNTLNLPTMARHFPITFARMMHTSLGPSEEHEPDFEDEEGELFWPGQLMTGEGLGWVCLMGKAMIKEFGKAYGYKGLDGVVPKPNPGEQMDDGGDAAQRAQQPQLSNTQSSGSTPLGQHGQPPRNYSSSSSHPQQGPSGSLQVPR